MWIIQYQTLSEEIIQGVGVTINFFRFYVFFLDFIII